MDSSNRLFRKAVFGGFNKDDVIDYIESMKNEFFEYRKQVEETIGELNKKISELEQAGNVVAEPDEFSFSDASAGILEPIENELKNNVSFSVEEINAATDHLKETADNLCKSLTEFMERISSSCIAVKVEAPIEPEAVCSDEVQEPAADIVCDAEPDNPDAPTPDEIAAAYQQALRIKGDSIIASAFNQDPASDESTRSDKEQNGSFSELLDSILNSHEIKQNHAEPLKDTKEEASILDSLLSSSSFLN